WGMLPASANGDASKRTAADNQTVRNVFVVGPDKKIKLILVYPMTTGRNFDEVLRVIDSDDHVLALLPVNRRCYLVLGGELQRASPAPATDTRLAPDVTGFYEATTGSIQYVVADPLTRSCAVIDPVLDFDPRSGSTGTTSADRLLKHIEAQGLT